MSAFGEHGGQERQIAYARRRKSGLEVPLVGRFYGENKRLVFAPPLWHDILVFACIVGGGLSSLGSFMGIATPGGIVIGLLVMAAGLWGAVSNERMICDLRTRTYSRFEGLGPGKRVIRGSLAELDALVLTTEQYLAGTGISASVIYRLVIYWKGMRHPPLIAEREGRSVPYGAPLNQSAHEIFQRGERYSRALGVPFYDNSHMYGKSPVPVI